MYLYKTNKKEKIKNIKIIIKKIKIKKIKITKNQKNYIFKMCKMYFHIFM